MKDAVNFYRQAAEQGHVKAQVRLGWLYFLKQEGVDQDLVESTKWFLKAAENGDAGAQDELGDAYYNGRGTDENLAEAIKWYEKAAAQDNNFSQFSLGRIYYYGEGIKKEKGTAFSWYMKSAQGGNVYAKAMLGYMYQQGDGVQKNIPEAIKWNESVINDPLYGKLNLEGGPSNIARINLASIYGKGDGIPKDARKAFQFQKQAADHGSTQALGLIANRYSSGNGVAKNLPVSIRLFAKAIKKNANLSGAKLGLLLAKFAALKEGKKAYAKKAYKKAYVLLIAAAEQKNAEAQYWVGRMYWDGKGTQSNWNEAVSWWKKAATQNQAQAMEALGEAYWFGIGTTKDKNEAIKYLLLSSDAKNKASAFIEKNVFHGWHYIANSDKDFFFINKSRITRDGGLRWFWIKDVPAPESVDSTYFFGSYSENYRVANCANKMIALKSITEYQDNTPSTTNTFPVTANSFSPVVPDSIGESELNYACSNFKKRTKTKKKIQKKASSQLTYSGTGWLVAGGYVVTNHHVVAGRKSIILLSKDGTKIPASVAIDDAINDLVLLKPESSKHLPPALPLANGPAQVGEQVFTVGYPHPNMMGVEPKLTQGIVNARTGLRNDPRVFQISVPLQAGNSGGPLVNMNGAVVGVVEAKLNAAMVFKWTGDLPQNVNYAVKVAYVRVLLSSVDPVASVSVLPSKKDNLAGLAKRIEGSVLMIIAK